MCIIIIHDQKITQAFNQNKYFAGPYIARGRGGSCSRQENSIFFSNTVFEFAELFLVAILVRNHKKID